MFHFKLFYNFKAPQSGSGRVKQIGLFCSFYRMSDSSRRTEDTVKSIKSTESNPN